MRSGASWAIVLLGLMAPATAIGQQPAQTSQTARASEYRINAGDDTRDSDADAGSGYRTGLITIDAPPNDVNQTIDFPTGQGVSIKIFWDNSADGTVGGGGGK